MEQMFPVEAPNDDVLKISPCHDVWQGAIVIIGINRGAVFIGDLEE